MQPESASHPDKFRFSVVAVVVGLSTVGGLTYSKGYPGFVENLYWYLGYSTGFVRRGLIGTLMAPIIRDMSPGDVTRLAAEIGTIAAGLLIVWIAVLCAGVFERLPRRHGLVWLAIALFWMMGPTLPTWAHIVGMLDVYMMLAVLAAYCLCVGRWPYAGLVLCVLGPAIHEGFVFLVLPPLLVLAATWPQRRAPALLSAALTITWTLIVWFGTSRQIIWPANAPFSPQEREAFAAWQLGQTATRSTLDTIAMYRSHWERAVFAFAYFLALPATITAVTAMSLPLSCVGRLNSALRIATGTGVTLSILATAYDLERFLVWGQAVNFLLCGIEFSAVPRSSWSARQSPRLRWGVLAFGGALAALSFLSPAFDAGFLGIGTFGNAEFVPAPLADFEAPLLRFYSNLP
jgi:hypothetical protein